jgi:phytoene desaturase
VFQRLAELGYPELERDTVVERIFTPDDWAASYNLMHGSAFGLAQNFFQIGPFRPANQDPRVKNLFFVGASTQPGTGLPTVLISARLASERVEQWAKQAGLAQALAPRPAPIGAEVAA